MENAMMQNASRVVRSARTGWHRLVRDKAGSTLALLAVLPVLAGAVAIGVETGQLYRVKRQMQSSADAAALAAAVDIVAGKTDTYTASAQYEAQRNGFTNGANSVTVTVNKPPTSGPNASNQSAVEVIITKTTGFSLGALLVNMAGGTSATFDMRARSVAAPGTYSMTTSSPEACVVALTTASEQGVSVTSFNNFASDCTVASNGRSTSANSNASIYVAGTNTSANANLKSVWTRGSFYSTANLTLTNAAQTNQTSSITDPFSSLATPAAGSCTYTNFNPGSGSSLTLFPGTYCGGISIDTTFNNVYFTAGTYYIANGDLYINHVNNVSCSNCVDGTSGVTIVLTQTTGNDADIGGFYISSENNVTLSAPPTGTYKGILAYQDRRASVGTMTSTAKIFSITSVNNAKVSGAIYFPNNRIDISNLNTQINSGTACTVWIGRYVKFANYNNNYIAGCDSFKTTPATITTTTTVTKGKVFE
jgi:Flp pilus assembly protein TadG